MNDFLLQVAICYCSDSLCRKSCLVKVLVCLL